MGPLGGPSRNRRILPGTSCCRLPITLRIGFFLKTEWIPVVSSALATGFLVVPVLMPVTRRFLGVCLAVLGLQALVGIVGFVLHMQMNLYAPGPNLFERSVYGAPPMAPLLFPNLVALALLGPVGRGSEDEIRSGRKARTC